MRLTTDTRNEMSKREFADSANRKYPINDKQHALQAYRYFLRPGNNARYDSGERSTVWNKIVKANKKFGNNISRTQLPGGDDMDELENAASELLDDYLSIEKAANEILTDYFCVEKAAEELLNEYFNIEIAAQEYIDNFEKGALSMPMGLQKGVGALAIGTGLLGSMSGAANQVANVARPMANMARIPNAPRSAMPIAAPGVGDSLGMIGQGAKLLKRKSQMPSIQSPIDFMTNLKVTASADSADEVEKEAGSPIANAARNLSGNAAAAGGVLATLLAAAAAGLTIGHYTSNFKRDKELSDIIRRYKAEKEGKPEPDHSKHKVMDNLGSLMRLS